MPSWCSAFPGASVGMVYAKMHNPQSQGVALGLEIGHLRMILVRQHLGHPPGIWFLSRKLWSFRVDDRGGDRRDAGLVPSVPGRKRGQGFMPRWPIPSPRALPWAWFVRPLGACDRPPAVGLSCMCPMTRKGVSRDKEIRGTFIPKAHERVVVPPKTKTRVRSIFIGSSSQKYQIKSWFSRVSSWLVGYLSAMDDLIICQ